MPHFTYIAKTADGRIERGSINAATLDDARERLRKQSLLVEELHASAGMLSSNEQEKRSTPAPAWVVTDAVIPASAPASAPAAAPIPAMTDDVHYAPIGDTLRLFAGWLLAWYGLVYLLGSYQMENKLPLSFAFIESMFTSPLILRFAFATYVFLFCGTLHRWLGGGIGKGILVTILGFIAFAFFHTSV